jgi:hypothetical protein
MTIANKKKPIDTGGVSIGFFFAYDAVLDQVE